MELDLFLDNEIPKENKFFTVTNNDLGNVNLNILLTNEGNPIDLNSVASVKLSIAKPDNKIVLQDTTITDATAGKLSVALAEQALIVEGRHYGQALIYYNDGKVSVSQLFSYSVTSALLSNATIQSKDEFQSINKTIEEIGDIVKTVSNLEEKGEHAQTQGDYAKTQGDYASEKGAEAESKALIANAATSEANLARDNANEQAEHAKTQGDYAKTEYERLKNTDVSTLSAELAEIAKLPKGYSGIGTNAETSISTAFPSVTLAEVQALDSNATLSDSADWYVLQKLIVDADSDNKSRKLTFPNGDFRLSRTLDFTNRLKNTHIEAHGCTLRPTNAFTGALIKLNRGTNYDKSRNLRMSGLSIWGEFRASAGIWIDDAQEWLLDNVKIRNCHVALLINDAFYGEISGEPVFIDNLVGIKMLKGASNENNTLEINNLKMNFATDKRNFAPQNVGESDEDYNNRVVSIGVQLESMVNGCKFNGLTLEGMDYGYYGTKTGNSGTSTNSIFGIIQNYLEAIKKSPFYLVSHSGYSNHNFNVTISECRIFSSPKSFIGQGTWNIFGNENFELEIKSFESYRTVLNTDLPSNLIKSDHTSSAIFMKREHIPTSGNALKYNNYNDNNTYPSGTNMLPTIQDELHIEHIPRIRPSGARTKNHNVFSLHTKPLAFSGKYAAPVIHGEDNKYYMVGTKDGMNLTLKEVRNINRIDYPLNGMESKELYRRTSVEGEKFYNIDIQQDVEFINSQWIQRKGTTSESIAFGNTSQIVNFTPPGNIHIWNVQIGAGYNWRSTYWAWGPDWHGHISNLKAIGVSADKWADGIDGFIYYATDESKYYIWNQTTATWDAFTPLF